MKSRFTILLSILALTFAALACQFGFSTANIADAWMSKDAAGEQRSTTFLQDELFYAQVDVRNVPEGTQLKAVWTAVSAAGEAPNTEINTTESSLDEDTLVNFELSNSNLWPAGNYKVEIYLNDKLEKTLDFEVLAPAISDAWLSSDDGGDGRVAAFPDDAVLYAQADLTNHYEGALVRAVWSVVSVEGVEPGFEIQRSEYATPKSENRLTFSLTNNGPWPVGVYKVDIYLEEALAKTLEFEIR